MITYPVTDKFKDQVVRLYKEKKKEIRKSSTPWVDGSGVNCIFIPLTKRIGIKVYLNRINATLALKRQAIAFRNGIAPEYGQMFYIVHNALKLFCHFTEVATLIHDDVRLGADGFPVGKEYDELREKIKVFKFPWVAEDMHRFNIGRVANRMVCIDFL